MHMEVCRSSTGHENPKKVISLHFLGTVLQFGGSTAAKKILNPHLYINLVAFLKDLNCFLFVLASFNEKRRELIKAFHLTLKIESVSFSFSFSV